MVFEVEVELLDRAGAIQNGLGQVTDEAGDKALFLKAVDGVGDQT